MSDSRLPKLKPHTVWMMAIASGAAVANLYYNQPLLAVIAQSLHASARAVGLIPVLTQVGYALGLFLFVPLGDLLERRKLIVTMLIATALALGIAAAAPNITWLIVASLLIDIHNRLNALFVMFHFIGGAVGSYLAAYGWSKWQWNGVCATALVMITIALSVHSNRQFFSKA